VVSSVVTAVVVDVRGSLADSSPVVGAVALDVGLRVAGVKWTKAVGFLVMDCVLVVVAAALVHTAAPAKQPHGRAPIPQKLILI
jgi:hypothetical protein